MKKIFFLVLASLFFGINYAQCPVADVILETQAEVNAFPTTYPGCSNLTVNLSIGKSDFTPSNITDLSPLSGLTNIGGYLYVRDNPNLSNLNGLSGLTNVTTGIYIDDNDGLLDLTGLTQLSTVGDVDVRNNDMMTSTLGMTSLTSMSGYFSAYNNPELLNFAGMSTISSITDFYVGSNPKLLDFNGFDSLTTITGFAQIENNAGLVNFNGLDNLETINGITYIYQNSVLENFSGLENLISIGGNLNIDDNDSLVDFTGLNSLETIGIFLRVVNNQIITNLNGFDSLVSLGSYFEVVNNPAMISLDGIETLTTINDNIQISGGMPNLVDISGIANIDYTTINQLFITDNTSLAVCEQINICEFLDNGGVSTISGNATGCKSPTQVTTACVPVLGIDDFSSEKEISFYPNPVKDKLFFNIPTNVEIEKVELYSLDGKLLKQYKLNSSELDLQSFETGIYIVKITSSKAVFSRKIIKT